MVKTRAIARILACAALLAGPLSCGPKSSGAVPPSAASALSGEPAPTFKRPTLAGNMLDTEALAGRVVVVKFFAEYCEPCKRTLPEAQELHRRNDDVAFIGISEDERQSDAESVVRSFGLTFPVVMDRSNVLAGRFRVQQLPITFVIDQAGRVAWVGGPQHGRKDLQAVLDHLAPG